MTPTPDPSPEVREALRVADGESFSWPTITALHIVAAAYRSLTQQNSELRADLAELKTPLKDWDKKLSEKNAALAKRNDEIAALKEELAQERQRGLGLIVEFMGRPIREWFEIDGFLKQYGRPGESPLACLSRIADKPKEKI